MKIEQLTLQTYYDKLEGIVTDDELYHIVDGIDIPYELQSGMLDNCLVERFLISDDKPVAIIAIQFTPFEHNKLKPILHYTVFNKMAKKAITYAFESIDILLKFYKLDYFSLSTIHTSDDGMRFIKALYKYEPILEKMIILE